MKIQGASVNRAIFKNVMKSKYFHVFSFNTYEHPVYIYTKFRFLQFQCNTFNILKK